MQRIDNIRYESIEKLENKIVKLFDINEKRLGLVTDIFRIRALEKYFNRQTRNNIWASEKRKQIEEEYKNNKIKFYKEERKRLFEEELRNRHNENLRIKMTLEKIRKNAKSTIFI
jgi:hypothetical protein